MTREFDLALAEGGTLHGYDTGGARTRLAVLWQHGTPNIGAPPVPLFRAAEQLGIRWVSFDRPGYGGSTPCAVRSVGSVASYVAQLATELGLDRFAVLGHSGGGSHALACAALLPERVVGVVSVSGLAPHDAAGLDWFAGMRDPGALRAAAAGSAAREKYQESAEFDPEMFTPADHAALSGSWSWFNEVVGPAVSAGSEGLIADDLAYVAPWGFDPAKIGAPMLLVHGGQDRVVPSAHGEWLAAHCPAADLRLYPDDGHISVLQHATSALTWLADHAR